MGIWYTTREDVKSALDIKETARNNAQVDDAIEDASRLIDGALHRRFYPETGTRYFNWPNHQLARSWRLWLEQDELISVTTLTSGGVVIPPSTYFLEPNNFGPPFDRIELDLSSRSAFSTRATHQRAIAVTGVFGYGAEEKSAGALVGALNATTTAVNVTDSTVIGVGSLLRVDSERMTVTGKSMADTGLNLLTPVTAAANVQTLAVTTGSAFRVGEVILLDSERIRIDDIAGNNLIVKRAWDGSTLAAHTGSRIWAPRTLAVTRGVLGTTASVHVDTAPVAKHVPPGPISSLAKAEAINTVLQETSGYAKAGADTTKLFTGRGLQLKWDSVHAAYGRNRLGVA